MPDGLGPALSEPLFDRLALIGIGLIGSSLARVCRRKGIVRKIIASDLSADVCARVHELGIADEVAESAPAAVEEADLVILCAPVGRWRRSRGRSAPDYAGGRGSSPMSAR